LAKVGGEEGIRTPGSLSTSTVFKTAALNHSATSPELTLNVRLWAQGSGKTFDRMLEDLAWASNPEP
jgi:hypothetical protein